MAFAPQILDGGYYRDEEGNLVIPDLQQIQQAVREWGGLVADFGDIVSGLFAIPYVDRGRLPALFMPAFRIFQRERNRRIEREKKKISNG